MSGQVSAVFPLSLKNFYGRTTMSSVLLKRLLLSSRASRNHDLLYGSSASCCINGRLGLGQGAAVYSVYNGWEGIVPLMLLTMVWLFLGKARRRYITRNVEPTTGR